MVLEDLKHLWFSGKSLFEVLDVVYEAMRHIIPFDRMSVAFYHDVLTFKPVSDMEVDGPEYDRLWGIFGVRARVVRMQLGGQQLELIEFLSPPDVRPIPVPSYSNDLWFQHFAIVVRDMDASVAFYERLGLAVTRVGDSHARTEWAEGARLEFGTAELTRSYDPNFREPAGASPNTLNTENR